MTDTKLPTDMSVEELEKVLAVKKAEAKKVHQAKKKAYETDRDKLIMGIGMAAEQIHEQLKMLKNFSMKGLVDFRGKMLEHGGLRNGEKNKGNFEIKNEYFKVQFSSQTVKAFDERSELGEAMLKRFLTRFVKKRDKEIFELVNALLQRNEKNGDFDIGMINRLYTMEDKFDDPDWVNGIRMFKDAYNPTGTAQYVRVYSRLENGSWEPLVLDFAKIKTGIPEKEGGHEN